MSIDRVSFGHTRVTAALAFLAVGVLGLSACGSDNAAPSATKTVVATATATVTAAAPTPSATPTPDPAPASDGGVGTAGGAATGDSFPMPNEVGKVLQAAQDDLQAASGSSFFYSDSEDATGAGRFQVLDRSWQVCSQNKAPGSKISKDDTSVSFKVVRNEESCP